jgi:methionyl-tRNA formyltransferase
LFIANRDKSWEERTLRKMCQRYAALPNDTAELHTPSPNSPAAERFIKACAPDIVLALCKTLLKPEVFSVPSRGTFVLHPGTCPEYRNAHGCFWALANDDLDKVAMTLLRIDAGVDTGPVYGHFSYPYDAASESHIVIQRRVVLENLDALRQRLTAICDGVAKPIETSGRSSATWGQPWLTRYFAWKYRARKRKARASPRPALS